MVVFLRILPLILALGALLALPCYLGGTARSGAELVDSVSRLTAFAHGDTEALEGFEAPTLSPTDWSAENYDDQWTPVVDAPALPRKGNPDLAAIVRATELPIDAHLARMAQE